MRGVDPSRRPRVWVPALVCLLLILILAGFFK